MSQQKRFNVVFIDEEAEKEYRKLDGSTKKLIATGIRRLEERADEIGKPLTGKLIGCKELKYRRDGIRVVFRIKENELGEMMVQLINVELIAIGTRSDGKVFDSASERLKSNK